VFDERPGNRLRASDIDVFYTKSKLRPRSKVKMIERLRHFFRFAVHGAGSWTGEDMKDFIGVYRPQDLRRGPLRHRATSR
jgi:hypothetical protein